MHGLCAVDLLEQLAEHRVVVREVDRLGDLGVALVEGLAALGAHDLEQLCALLFELLARAVQNACALVGAERLPTVGCSYTAGDDGLEGVGVGHLGGSDEVVAELRVDHAVCDLAAPDAVARQVGVGVGGVVELALAAGLDERVDARLGTGGVVRAAILEPVRCGHLVRLD